MMYIHVQSDQFINYKTNTNKVKQNKAIQQHTSAVLI